MECSVAELMSVVLSHEFRDDDFGAVGTASYIPVSAMRLAQRTHAPNLWFLYGGSGAINSKSKTLVEMAADYRNLFGAEYRASIADHIDFEFTGRLTVGTFGGMQIDQYGNVNMVCIGDYERPTVRGPGTVGLTFTALNRRIFLYVQHHNPRLFVKKVDFMGGPSIRTKALSRHKTPVQYFWHRVVAREGGGPRLWKSHGESSLGETNRSTIHRYGLNLGHDSSIRIPI